MLLTLEAPSTALLGKTRQAPSRCSSWTRPERVSKIRHRDCSASVAAASMNLQPWHSMDRDSTSSTAAALCYALKQLAMHQSRPKASLQQAPHPVWHGIELQRHSNAGQPSEACSGAIAAAASAALRIPSPDSLQVRSAFVSAVLSSGPKSMVCSHTQPDCWCVGAVIPALP